MKKILQIKLKDAEYITLGCSAKGKGKEANQDSFLVYGDASRIICIVADGLGSMLNAEIGSQTVCKVAKDLIVERGITKEFPELLKQKWAQELKVTPYSCDTTFKFVVVDEQTITYGGIGDGWIVGIVDGKFFEHRSVNSFSNQTDSILSVGYEDKFQIVEMPYREIQILSLASDGFSEDIESDGTEGFMKDCLSELRSGAEMFADDLEKTMNNWPIKTNEDDKTIVVCGRSK